jgi:hypothetical protein
MKGILMSFKSFSNSSDAKKPDATAKPQAAAAPATPAPDLKAPPAKKA